MQVNAPMLVAATFRHITSRNNDPQLHTHCVVANMTRYLEQWRSAEIGLLRRSEKLIGAFYRNELARRTCPPISPGASGASPRNAGGTWTGTSGGARRSQGGTASHTEVRVPPPDARGPRAQLVAGRPSGPPPPNRAPLSTASTKGGRRSAGAAWRPFAGRHGEHEADHLARRNPQTKHTILSSRDEAALRHHSPLGWARIRTPGNIGGRMAGSSLTAPLRPYRNRPPRDWPQVRSKNRKGIGGFPRALDVRILPKHALRVQATLR